MGYVVSEPFGLSFVSVLSGQRVVNLCIEKEGSGEILLQVKQDGPGAFSSEKLLVPCANRRPDEPWRADSAESSLRNRRHLGPNDCGCQAVF